jgi:hypothetical protein
MAVVIRIKRRNKSVTHDASEKLHSKSNILGSLWVLLSSLESLPDWFMLIVCRLQPVKLNQVEVNSCLGEERHQFRSSLCLGEGGAETTPPQNARL